MGAAAQHILNEENSSNKLNLFQVIDIFQARRSEERNMKTRAVPGEGRLSWDRHVEYLHEINLFESVYRMKEKTFNKLVDKIWYKIAVDELQSMRSTSSNDPIYPEMVVALGICFLGGELPKSLFELYRLSLTLVEQVIDKFILAVANCDNLAIKLQETEGELFDLAEGFKNISGADDLFYGVVAALDEWLCTSESPWNVTNAGDFFSGHYKRYGLNVQAICDESLCFIYICVAGLGRTNDNRAFHRLTDLRKW